MRARPGGEPEPEMPSWALRQERRRRRPTWVLVLAMAMLVFGGHLLTSGLSTLQALRDGPRKPTGTEAVINDLRVISRSLEQDHPWAVRTNVFAKLTLAGLLLFAVAAVLSWDPKGRLAALVAAWVGIVYHLGEGLFLLFVVRHGVVAAAPLLATVARQHGTGPSVEEMASFANTFMVVLSLVTAGVGITFSLVLMAYFGGRKGRVFYGLERPAPHGA